jgi:hypothetical protein
MHAGRMGQRDAVVTYFPQHCERFVVLLPIEKVIDIADELKLHLIVARESHCFTCKLERSFKACDSFFSTLDHTLISLP